MFPSSSKAIVQEMISLVEGAFHDNLPTLDWMDDDTRDNANTKLNMGSHTEYPIVALYHTHYSACVLLVESLIGYPSTWATYEGVNVTSTHLAANRFNLATYEWMDSMKKLRSPVNKKRWTTPAFAVVQCCLLRFRPLSVPHAQS
jgi:predicted metalloendopeptidase